MKILSAKQIKQADEYTIAHEPISSLALMERAAKVLCDALVKDFGRSAGFWIFCGPGNNGGDGLALARLLLERGDYVHVFEVRKSEQGVSSDFAANRQRLKELDVKFDRIRHVEDLQHPPSQEIIVVDALFGNGLSRPLDGMFAQVVAHINAWSNKKVAIDIPSGLYADDNAANESGTVFRADITYTLQAPKLSFMHRQTAFQAGVVKVLDIGIHPKALEQLPTPYFFYSSKEAKDAYRPRGRFGYKNTYGHAILMMGSRSKLGAALLSAKACMRAGVGLLDVALPKGNAQTLNIYLPEAMLVEDPCEEHLTQLPDLMKYQAIGFGSGVGTNGDTQLLLEELLKSVKQPLVLDADALNILANAPSLLEKLPENTLLTPHIGEFKRLLGVSELGYDYLERARVFAQRYKVVLILKDAISTIALADGTLHFVNEGSVALATAGSGDVLSGILVALLANGYHPAEAAKLGVYLHAYAGKKAGEQKGVESTLASDVAEFLGGAFQHLQN